jgi:hypothetical protein
MECVMRRSSLHRGMGGCRPWCGPPGLARGWLPGGRCGHPRSRRTHRRVCRGVEASAANMVSRDSATNRASASVVGNEFGTPAARVIRRRENDLSSHTDLPPGRRGGPGGRHRPTERGPVFISRRYRCDSAMAIAAPAPSANSTGFLTSSAPSRRVGLAGPAPQRPVCTTQVEAAESPASVGPNDLMFEPSGSRQGASAAAEGKVATKGPETSTDEQGPLPTRIEELSRVGAPTTGTGKAASGLAETPTRGGPGQRPKGHCALVESRDPDG